jgi:hypothetical protein
MMEWLKNADPIALWGAVISTVLAIREIAKSRTKIEIGYNFTGSPEIGNEIIIRNISASPIIIPRWELLWIKRRFLMCKKIRGEGHDEFNSDISLAEHSSTSLTFVDQHHFDWGWKSLNGAKIYLKLHIAGKKWPRYYKVYG